MECPHAPGFHTAVRARYGAAAQEFGRLVAAVPKDRWSASTPCPRWTVRDLVNHVTAQHLWVCQLLGGYTPEQLGRRFEGDVLGVNPEGVWQSAAHSGADALAAPGAPDRLIHPPYGLRDAGGYAVELIAETVVHSWDLARALGEPGRMAPEAAAFALTEFRGYRNLAATGLFEPELPAPAGADAQTRLLALTGRDPAWAAL
ncbi:TIGR03086 family metal-binding protein [Kitasatospora sp. NPDC048365]|uniref:TIGR03086 family metal-binding protein n=1 Tax=Kitasatospora sp. NPDC048365 TaxID=3364050 RepID=UPI0037187414